MSIRLSDGELVRMAKVAVEGYRVASDPTRHGCNSFDAPETESNSHGALLQACLPDGAGEQHVLGGRVLRFLVRLS